ncbi:MAG: FecR family protein [Steroidobacter sp.]
MMEQRDNNKLAAMSEEAAEWFVRLRDDDLRIADQYQYLQWLKESPAHVAEMLRLCRVYGMLKEANLQPFRLNAETTSNVIGLSPREKVERPPPRTDARGWKIAAALSTFTLAVLLGLMANMAWFDNTIETAAGEWRVLTLADGSVVRLGPRTRLRAEFGDTQRFVHLASGEALFEVARNSVRPFSVNTELALVRAVGTAFGVAHREDRVIVTVSEGAVAVTQGARNAKRHRSAQAIQDPGDLGSVAVSAGGQVSVAQTWPVAVHQVNVERELAWADGRLIFENETIAEAIAEFNRRNRIQMVLHDTALSRRPVRGVFRAADPESFAQFLSTALPVAIVREKTALLRLEPVPATSQRDEPIEMRAESR